MERLCPKCGKRKPFDILCEQCYIEEHPMVKGFKDIEVVICHSCGLYMFKGKWTKFNSLKEAALSIAKSKVKLNPGAILLDFKVKPVLPKQSIGPGVSVLGTLEVEISGKVHSDQKAGFTETYEIPLKVNYTICKDCGRQGTTYYEGILQVRNLSKDIEKYIEKAVDKTRGVFVTDVKRHKNGADFYITSNKFLVEFGKKLFANFGGDWKLTRKLFSRNNQTGKNIYRVTFRLTLPDFSKGDIVKQKSKIILVESVKGKKVYGVDLVTMKHSYLDFSDELEIAARNEDIKKTVVSKAYPHIEVIHPETFQSVKVANLAKVNPGSEVKVAIVDDKVYLV